MEGVRRSVNPELWHACAGPRVSLPYVGSLVVYFPQGHSEQVAVSTQKEVDRHIPNYPNLQSQLICELHNITLHADAETDEVFAQMTLQPVNGGRMHGKDAFLSPDLGTQNRQPTDFFCKTLTASDTSTHGGFSVPRRAAEKVFPPLDMSKQPPVQELQAKDLHDRIWTFRHIYRGQPKRHLLTTGWSVFVSSKQLVASDSVLFIRDEKGHLLLGIRRADRPQTALPSSVLSSDSMHIGVLAAAAHAAATNSRFIVFYNPRASPSEFIIPLEKYNKAIYGNQVYVGMRFRMVFETEESTLRRYMGTITGISDLDHIRWPNSQWHNLEVGWDETNAGDRPCRVSMWEIEPVSTPFLICPPPFPLRPKRFRHPGLIGEESDMGGNTKRCLAWLRGESSNNILSFQGLGADAWMRMQQGYEVLASTLKPDFYHTIAGNVAIQEFRTIDPSKQQLQHQQPQQMQFRMPHKQHGLQQQLQQQPLSHDHLFQSHPPQQSFLRQLQQLQSPLTQQVQTQPLSQLQGTLQQQQQLQPTMSQQQLSVLPPQQQAVQCSDIPPQLLQLSSSRPHSTPITAISMPMKAPATFSEADVPVGTTSNAFSSQSILGRPHSVSLPLDNNGQLSYDTHPNITGTQQQQSQHLTFLYTALPREVQSSGTWLSSRRESVHNESTSTMPSVQMGQADAASTPCSLSLPLESLAQDVLASLPSQTSSFAFQESCEDQEGQADPQSCILSGVNIDSSLVLQPTSSSTPSRELIISKDSQSWPFTTNILSRPFSSPSRSFPSSPLADLPISSGMMVGGHLDESLLQHSCNWSHIPGPVPTFTKVQKLGSIGRSLDVSQFRNYDELRRELAHMFNLEGQLENPQSSTWQLVFVDHEEDVLLVGDDPWEEFVSCVRIIKILSPSEVLQMGYQSFDMLNSIPMVHQTRRSSEDLHAFP